MAFSSVPPATPVPDNNGFHAAQGASVVFGAEPRGTALDTTYPLPAEQTLANAIPCPALGALPTPWSTQNPQAFSVNGQVSTFDNGGTSSPLAEGAYDLHYFSVDCDSFEELVYPPTLDIHTGTPGPNVASFKTAPFNIDTTKPTVNSITLNPPGGYYAQNSAGVTATVSCSDPSSPTVANFFSGIAVCGSQTFSGNLPTVTTTPIPLSTSTLGTQTFTANAVDAAGNSYNLQRDVSGCRIDRCPRRHGQQPPGQTRDEHDLLHFGREPGAEYGQRSHAHGHFAAGNCFRKFRVRC